ncbi:NAD(P)/FAD-dependent oxidoreductase [Haladaptatus sp. NG-WS-4]
MERTVVLGCGEAGLIAAAHLERAPETDVIVVSESDRHVFSFLLYHVLEGMPFNKACIDLQGVFRDKDVTFTQAHVEGLNTVERRVELRAGSLWYDKLLIALGGVTRYSIDDRRHVFDIRTDAREIRRAAHTDDVANAVVVGGGPIGVETSATLSSITVDLGVTLIASSPRLLSDLPARASRLAERELRRRDVRVLTNARVTKVTRDSVVVDGEREVQSDLTIWAGGIRPNPVIKRFTLPRNERGLRVDSRLRCLRANDVYAAGDNVDYPAKVTDGYTAGREARTAAINVLRTIRGRHLKEYDVRWHPRVIYLGENTALFTMNGIVHCGRSPSVLRELAAKTYPFYWKYLY